MRRCAVWGGVRVCSVDGDPIDNIKLAVEQLLIPSSSTVNCRLGDVVEARVTVDAAGFRVTVECWCNAESCCVSRACKVLVPRGSPLRPAVMRAVERLWQDTVRTAHIDYSEGQPEVNVVEWKTEKLETLAALSKAATAVFTAPILELERILRQKLGKHNIENILKLNFSPSEELELEF